jgi:hypothetical protein
MKKMLVITGILLVLVAILAACGEQSATQAPAVEQPTTAPAPTAEPTEEPIPPYVLPLPVNPREVLVQAAYDGDQVALRFTWVSTKDYAGQYHDFVQYKEGAWNRLPSAVRVEEDRVAVIFDNPAQAVPGFATMGCYIACHSDMNNMPEQFKNAEGANVDARHYVLAPEGTEPGAYALDMWHWRGGRSGPMGYAEDTWVAFGAYGTGAQGRNRDKASGPTNWIRSGGDRLYEDQTWGGDFLFWNETMLPRFVFNPEKSGFNNYFLSSAEGVAFTDAQTLVTTVEDIDYVSSLIIYQDPAFDGEDKVNSIDVLYLLVTAGAVDATALPEYNSDWATYWADQTGVADAEAAAAMLDDIVASMEEGVMVTRSVNFLFGSSQHEIPAERDFDYDTNTWTVTMVRSLSTGTAGVDDVDLSALTNGTLFPFAFAMHDVSKGSETHFISFPFTLGTAEADVVAMMVDDVFSADWANIPGLSTVTFAPPVEFAYENLTDSSVHPGAAVIKSMNCQSCHSVDPVDGIITKTP